MSKRRLISSDEAVPAKGQHVKPCSDCPWARAALPGWLGGIDAATWLLATHGEEVIGCHTLKGAQCAGAATYRANVLKRPRDKGVLLLPADRGRVFAAPAEFLAHHGRGPKA